MDFLLSNSSNSEPPVLFHCSYSCVSEMASLQVPPASAQPQIVRQNGEVLPPTAISDLKSKVKSEVLVKGEATEDAYRAAIHRWNEAFITEAVSYSIVSQNWHSEINVVNHRLLRIRRRCSCMLALRTGMES